MAKKGLIVRSMISFQWVSVVNMPIRVNPLLLREN